MVDAVRNSYKNGKQRPCLVLPCGGGKSCIVADMAKKVTDKGNYVLFIVHRKELCQQITDTFIAWGVNMGLCFIGMVQSIKKHLPTMPKPSLIIFDEGHHILAKTYLDVLEHYSDVKCVAVTATPVRLGGSGLGDVCDDLVVGVTAQWLIDNNYLSPYKYYSVPVAKFDNIKTTRGDYDVKQLSEIMEDNKIYGDTVQNYKNIADGKKTIVYCSSVKSSKDTAEEFCRHGYSAVSLDGKTSKDERLRVMQDFRSGNVKILCNADLFGEGLDVPDVECVILLRKTKSLTLFIQQSMRCMRYQQNKTAIIIDHVGNVFEHGFPDDDRAWTLDAKKHNEQNEIKIKTCPSCFAVIEQNTLKCPYCQHDFSEEVRERKEKELIEAQLIEMQRQHEQELINMPFSKTAEFTTFEQLVEYQQIKKYKFMWCLRRADALKIEVPTKYKNMWRYAK